MTEENRHASPRKFPTFAVALLVIGAFWLFSELGWITASIPWIPIVLIIVAISWIIASYRRSS